ncbi:hypothetical protein MBLNU230_g3224t1 [Neophaeotheca triangularis]
MFAVKGWSVDSSSLKPQTEPAKPPKNAPQESGEKPNKKRKRETTNVTNENVARLWEEHVEGKKPAKKEKKEKARPEKQQKEERGAGKESQSAGGEADGNGAIEGKESRGTQKLKRLKEKKKREKEAKSGNGEDVKAEVKAAEAAANVPPPAPVLPATAKLTPMQSAMRQKLTSARFRHLNETLYTAPSEAALKLFASNPEMFEDYHAGFRQQVSVWPENPLDNFIRTLRQRGNVRQFSQKKAFKSKDKKGAAQPESTVESGLAALPRTSGTSTVADLGCGDARLAQTLKDSGDMTKLNLKIHSFDLHSPSPLVTKADISNLPMAEGSADVALFCLALMGTNWISFIEEAYRILHWKGELWVAEIKSRFGRVGKAGKPVEHSVGNKKKQAAAKKAQEAKQKEEVEVNENVVLATEVDGVEVKQQETDVSAFIDVLRRRGFVLKDGDKSVDLSNKMFVKMEFVKAATPTKGKGAPEGGIAPAGNRQGETWKPKEKKKFIDETAADDIATDDEAKVLKPCLYKIR